MEIPAHGVLRFGGEEMPHRGAGETEAARKDAAKHGEFVIYRQTFDSLQ
jgi:hypothetical protein